MRRRPLVRSLGALLLASIGLANAQNAFTSRPMNVRAGPNRDYPLVAQLDPGAPLDVHGCLTDWSWCDVSFDDSRGWIYAGGVSFVYQGGRVPLYSYGPHLGLPIITFSLLSYWGDYYRGRPWYRQRDEWTHRRLPPHTRPPGRPYAAPPPAPHGRPPSGARPAPRVPGHRGAESRTPAFRGPASRAPARVQPPPPARPHAGPPSMTHGRPASGNGSARRGGESGHPAPPARGGRPQEHPRGSQQPPGHPPLRT